MGIRDLRGSLSGYLRRVRNGESLVVTDRGEPVARIIPVGMPEGLARLVREGGVSPPVAPLPARLPTVRLRGSKTAAELLIEDRLEPWERPARSPRRRARSRR